MPPAPRFSRRVRAMSDHNPTVEQKKQFMRDLAENEKALGEEAALALACEQWGIDYVSGEWIEYMTGEDS
jgi:hypothetical protein